MPHLFDLVYSVLHMTIVASAGVHPAVQPSANAPVDIADGKFNSYNEHEDAHFGGVAEYGDSSRLSPHLLGWCDLCRV